MTKINLADVDSLIEQGEDAEIDDRREMVRGKQAKVRFKENRIEKDDE